jgi:hypothetical protein
MNNDLVVLQQLLDLGRQFRDRIKYHRLFAGDAVGLVGGHSDLARVVYVLRQNLPFSSASWSVQNLMVISTVLSPCGASISLMVILLSPVGFE